MSLEDLIQPSIPYSKKLIEKVLTSRNAGMFCSQEAKAHEMRTVEGKAGVLAEGTAVIFYWLVDTSDGQIVDAKFQVFGPPALIGAADAAVELLVGKNYDQARRLGADMIEKKLRDKPDVPSMPQESLYLINFIIDALDRAADSCSDIALKESYVSPIPKTEGGEGYPGWLELSYEKKLAVIEEVLDAEVRPYVELDDGGIEVQKLIDNRELIIGYKGSCTSCYSSIGATLSTIQQIIQSRVHPDLTVSPNMDELKL